LAALVVIAALAGAWWRSTRRPPSTLATVVRGVPFTSYPGREISPALSPDGTQVAFAWDGADGGNYDVYVKQRNTETPLRLTETPGSEYYVAWSPDGSTLAFAGETETGTALFTVPAIGGATRKLLDVGRRYAVYGLDWSPAGDQLVFSAQWEAEAPRRLLLFTLATRETTSVTLPPPRYGGDFRPAFSPDGETIAFTRSDRFHAQDVWIVRPDDGTTERLTHTQHRVEGLDWTRDGRYLIFASGPDLVAEINLRRLEVATGKLTWLPAQGSRVLRPSLAAAADVLVYEEQRLRCDIQRHRVGDPVDTEEAFTTILASTRNDYSARYSPAGNRIAFVSTRSGHPEVWISHVDGSGLRQLTDLGGAYVENAIWSWDERFVAFNATSEDYSVIWVAEVAGGTVRRLTPPTRHHEFMSWSRDGEHLYIRAEQDGGWHTYRMPSAGGEPELLLAHDTYLLCEAAGEDSLYYAKPGLTGLYKAARDGTGSRVAFEPENGVWPCFWRITDDGVHFFRRTEAGYAVGFHDFATGDVTSLSPVFGFPGFCLDVAPDGETLIFDRSDEIQSDLILVEDFR
jgi:Tol biopolymer transport system component